MNTTSTKRDGTYGMKVSMNHILRMNWMGNKDKSNSKIEIDER
jgi:hypothetical protein